MTRIMARRFSLVILVLSLATILTGQNTKTTLVGVWKVAELDAADGTKNMNPSGLLIFTPTHFSIVYVNNTTTPRPLIDTAAATTTDAQKVSAWQPFAAASGTYEVQGGEFTTHPLVAKNPTVMKPGWFQTYSLKAEGSAMWIQPLKNQDGPVTNAVRLKLIRVN